MTFKIGIPFFIILFILSFIFLVIGCRTLFDLNFLKFKTITETDVTSLIKPTSTKFRQF